MSVENPKFALLREIHQEHIDEKVDISDHAAASRHNLRAKYTFLIQKVIKPPTEGTPDELNGGCKSLNLTHLLLASLGGLVAAAAFARESFLRRRKAHQGDSMGNKDQKIAPLIERKDSGRRSNLERFPHYVARQLGFEDPNECPQLCKLANAYLVKTKGYDENVYEYLVNEAEPDSLYVHLLEEFERCILTYFAFNWTQFSNLISQVLSDESDQKAPKLKDFVMAATRKQRFERVTKDLKVTRVFSTLVEEMKVINVGSSGESHCTEVMSPVAHNKRSPVLLLMGGGMGAGKSTVLKDILHEPFWSEAGDDAVLIEADAFKETDVIYRALSSRGHHDDMLQTAELVHQSSTDAASSLLVTALNEGRDVIMDGTLSWEPFVEQMITMARNVHKHRYRMGAGYKVNEDGTTTEEYWRKEETEPNGKQQNLKPYRIELVGVVCDAYLAVARGIRRALMVKRAVRVKSQLKSHKSFANAFPKYCELVDNARLYCTNAVGGPPRLIAWKAGNSRLLVDPEDIECLKRVSNLNPDAESIYELYSDPNLLSQPGSVWTEIVIVPSRPEADVEPEVAAAGVPKKRTFKKFAFKGVDLDALLDMSTDDLVKLFPSRIRRRFSRGLTRKPMALIKKLRKAKREAPQGEKPEPVRTHLRNMIIVPEMIGSIIGVYNGKTFNQVEIKPEMIGHYLAEFSISYKPVKHGRPGVGATHSSRFIPLK
ncbi:hypothetical protein IGI04_032773 [Brassica rapa subsp. trilocularis]|uniref:Zeta toxin domain-containing protein n=1 Tax=Brassica rapa subsp. trilocularis TaxID=1813537 RepID=A0ABQ7LXC9_BRACM|nr:hypothetical protein IGI04_032773 [Brassica rapa subsp. trilocularis]